VRDDWLSPGSCWGCRSPFSPYDYMPGFLSSFDGRSIGLRLGLSLSMPLLFACRFEVVFAVAVVVRLLLRRLVAVARRSLPSMTALAFARLSLVVARPLIVLL
jgi:hypothetical protein